MQMITSVGKDVEKLEPSYPNEMINGAATMKK
jgi:hypothetical protein